MSTSELWKIPGGGERCGGCAEPLVAGALVTTLVRLLPEGPQRTDLCARCGEAVGGSAEAFYWRRRRPERSGPRPVVDYTLLRDLFGRLLERPDELYRRLAYLIALVLIRKRHLRLLGFEQRQGREVMVVSRAADQPPLDVPAPWLSPADMLTVREHLTRLLNADLQDHDLPELLPPGDPSAAPSPAAAAGLDEDRSPA